MKFIKVARRLAVIAGVAFVSALLVVPGVGAMTLAADIPSPEAPRPLNVLPSTVRGSLPMTGVPGSQQYLATMLYSYARTPAFWQAAARVNAGTATGAEITLVQQANGTYAVPATKLETLGKVVGGVSTAIGGYSAGVTIGAGTLDVLREVGILGFDPDGAVCGAVGATFAPLLGADCSGFLEFPSAFEPNTDAAEGWGLSTPICNLTGTWCAVVVAINTFTWKPSGAWATGHQICFDRTVGAGAPPDGIWGYNTGEGAEPKGTLGLAGTNFAGTWQGATGTNLTNRLTMSGGTYTPNPVACPAGADYALIWSWNRNNTGTTWGVPALPSSLRIGDAGEGVPAAAGDPLRVLRCVIVASGEEFSLDSATFRESEGVLPKPVCPPVPAGLVLESTRILEVNLDDGSWLELWSQATTDEFQAVGVLAPECGSGTCMLDLRLEGVGSCFQSPTSCKGWFADPDKGSKYSCHYGTHVVDLAECTVYAPSFEPGATTTGNVYGDPASGAAVQNPNPVAGTDPDGSGVACFPSGWGVFNPLEWVYRPVVCAATWAFVPRTEVVQEHAATITTAWADTLPAQAPQIVNGWIAALPEDVGGCQGPPINLDEAFGEFDVDAGGTRYPLSACDPPWDWVAGIARVVSTGAVALAAAFAVTRYLGMTIGFGGFGAGGRGGVS